MSDERNDSVGGSETLSGVAADEAKAIAQAEADFGVRPDFTQRGHPGFYAKDENEWHRNMNAGRKLHRFSSESIRNFMRKNPGRMFYVRNPNKEKDYMYPVNRKKR